MHSSSNKKSRPRESRRGLQLRQRETGSHRQLLLCRSRRILKQRRSAREMIMRDVRKIRKWQKQLNVRSPRGQPSWLFMSRGREMPMRRSRGTMKELLNSC